VFTFSTFGAIIIGTLSKEEIPAFAGILSWVIAPKAR